MPLSSSPSSSSPEPHPPGFPVVVVPPVPLAASASWRGATPVRPPGGTAAPAGEAAGRDPGGASPDDAAARVRDLVARARSSPGFGPAGALAQASAADVVELLHPRFVADGDEPLAVGLGASPGAAAGRIALSADAAIAASADGHRVILVRTETSPDDVLGMQSSVGILTSRGGLASHAAVVARGWGIPAVVGAEGVQVDGDLVRVGGRVLREGDVISIDGSTGEVLDGEREVAGPSAPAELEVLLGWADEVRRGRVAVLANADTAADARAAVRFGADGIGLCRTEHMFLAEDRLPLVRRIILSDDPAESARALESLEQAQVQDLTDLLAAVGDRPVTVRLLDPPLHEFLPDPRSLVADEARGELDDAGRELLAAVRRLHEINPMLGTRGVRLGVVTPGLYPMQVRAICRAVQARRDDGGSPQVGIMVPLVTGPGEMVLARRWVDEAVAAVGDEGLRGRLGLGTMVETPRAALLAGALAVEADFFSFGTNDLTQLTYAFSRDDTEARLLPAYVEAGLLTENPFATLDVDGVGRLIEMAAREGRAASPVLKLGACGEHAGDPGSVHFLVRSGLDSLSCSPYRVPAARLAVAQALIEEGAAAPVVAPGVAPSASVAEAGPPRPAGLVLDDPTSSVEFRVRHALRIKGFAPAAVVAELAGVRVETAMAVLSDMEGGGAARYLEARSLWALTPSGKDVHAGSLPGSDPEAVERLHRAYEPFVPLNVAFKDLCTAWQVRDGAANPHDDPAYDQARIDDLDVLHEEASPILDGLAGAVRRYGLYPPRLAAALDRVRAGDHGSFTGVMCGSYHDVWMELHEDLILVLGIDRRVEGSF